MIKARANFLYAYGVSKGMPDGVTGEGMLWPLVFAIVLFLIAFGIVIWKIMQKKKSVYTYKYKGKK